MIKLSTVKKELTLHPFSREDTNFLKGISILLIVLHNYYRWINPIIGENEFEFSAENIVNNLILLQSNPLELLHVFFKFLGHYGILSFIVISAYGLTLSFTKSRPGYGRFLLRRFGKIYPSLILAGIVFVVYSLMMDGRMPSTDLLHDMLLHATLLTNLIPGKAMAFAGPWWFYSFIFQFYMVFPALFWVNRRYGGRGLSGLALGGYFLTIMLYSPLLKLNLNPYQMVIGHLPEFCLGMYLASKDKIRLPLWALLLALLVAIGGNIYRWLWPFANLGVAVVLVITIQRMLRWRDKLPSLFSTISFLGMISMYLFACHGYLRWQFIPMANKLASPLTGLVIGLTFVVIATGVAYLMMLTEKSINNWISGPEEASSRYGRFFVLFFLTVGGVTFLALKG